METRGRVLEMLAAGQAQAEIARRLGITKGTVAYHARRVHEPDRRFRRRYDWKAVQAYYDLGHTVNECVAHFGFSKQTWHAAKNRGAIVTRNRAMSIEQLLSAPRNRAHLKRRLISAGMLPAHCQSCGTSQWRGRPLALELHHVNGDGKDNRLANLELLCPNCHSQTDSWGGRNSRDQNCDQSRAHRRPEPELGTRQTHSAASHPSARTRAKPPNPT
jgi:5-methylcytosine-specific restriction endonuclease McrA